MPKENTDIITNSLTENVTITITKQATEEVAREITAGTTSWFVGGPRGVTGGAPGDTERLIESVV